MGYYLIETEGGVICKSEEKPTPDLAVKKAVYVNEDGSPTHAKRKEKLSKGKGCEVVMIDCGRIYAVPGEGFSVTLEKGRGYEIVSERGTVIKAFVADKAKSIIVIPRAGRYHLRASGDVISNRVPIIVTEAAPDITIS